MARRSASARAIPTRIPVGGGTGGARSLYSEGQAILVTTDTVIGKGKQAAAEVLEAAVADIGFERGPVQHRRHRSRHRHHAAGRDPAGARRRAASRHDAGRRRGGEIDFHTFPNGCHHGRGRGRSRHRHVDVLRYVVCDDFGKAVNPLIVRGQVQGGVAQGFGQAVMERTAYDPESGQLLSGTFMDYALPRADDLPHIEVELLEIPCATNPLGVKGAGEAGAVGSPPAVMNAIIDALAARRRDARGHAGDARDGVEGAVCRDQGSFWLIRNICLVSSFRDPDTDSGAEAWSLCNSRCRISATGAKRPVQICLFLKLDMAFLADWLPRFTGY